MKQTICYLYEYESYKQSKNVGFVKCILKKDKVTFQIHGKGLDCDKFMDLEIFLFTSNGETYQVDAAGNVEGFQGVVNYMVTVDALDYGQFQNYDGVLLESVNHKQYVASWKSKEVYLKDREVPEQLVTNLVEAVDKAIEVAEEDVEPLNTKQEENAQEENVQEEIDRFEEGVSRENEGVFEKENDKREEIDTKRENAKITYDKINRHGIANLPQREWKWANNHFLLHGYANYKHLMLIRENGKLFLGIPGIYHSKEEIAARSFGFSMFHPMDELARAVADIEWNEKEQFGYWCRPITERKGMEGNYDKYEYTR